MNRPTIATSEADRAASTAAVAPAPGAAMRAASCPRKSPIDWPSSSSRRSPALTSHPPPSSSTARPDRPALPGEQPRRTPAPQRVEHRELARRRAGPATVRTRSCRRPSSSRRARSTPGRQPDGGGRRPPPPVEPHGEVRRGGLGQLAVLVDQDDVVGLRVPEGPRQVHVTAGGLVLEPRAGGVHRVVVQRQAHRPRADRRHGLQLDLDVAVPGQQDPHARRLGPPRHGLRARRRRTRVRSKRKPAQSAESAMRARCRSRLRSPSPGTNASVSRSRCSVTSWARTAALACSSARSGRRLGAPGDAAARPVHGLAGACGRRRRSGSRR